MVVMHKRSDGGPEVLFAEEHHSLQALGPGGFDKPFGTRVHIGTPGPPSTGEQVQRRKPESQSGFLVLLILKSSRPFGGAHLRDEPEAGPYAVVFRGVFAASASRRAEIASKTASFACSIDAMA